jgi:hypothetical protein
MKIWTREFHFLCLIRQNCFCSFRRMNGKMIMAYDVTKIGITVRFSLLSWMSALFCVLCCSVHVEACDGLIQRSTYLLTYLLTHSMMQDIIWKADSHLACQKSCFLYGNWRFINVFTKLRHWTLSKESSQDWGALKHFVTIFFFLRWGGC